MTNKFRLLLLGQMQAERAGQRVTGLSPKPLALLGYLVAQQQPLSREHLADLLWQNLSAQRGRANLSWTLNKLSSALPGCLETGRHTVQFRRSGACWVDLDAFELLVARGDPDGLAEAAALYRGTFLDGLSVDGCAGYELWLVGERERWRQRAEQALTRLIAHYGRLGLGQEALRSARRLLVLAPWREETHRQVMHLLAASGQRGAALAQYESCRQALETELDVAPSEETVALYKQIASRGMVSKEIEPAPAAFPRHNLPTPLTPFIGRESLLGQVQTDLLDPACRLLTLVGPGGSGKTRLALEAATRQIRTYPDGVFFVPLAPLNSAAAILPTIAQAIGLTIAKRGASQAELLNTLRQKRMLLVLDNFEHLIGEQMVNEHLRPSPMSLLAEQALDGAGLVAHILNLAPQVKVLITSRARLNVPGEHLIRVGGMDVPPDQDESLDANQYSAVQLFLQSARQVEPGITPTAQDLTHIAHICRFVQGMPLGILLAASWMQVLAPAEIAGELGQDRDASLDFLKTDWRGIPQRHRSLRAVFDHAWRQLTVHQQEILQALSVFCGGGTHEAIQKIAGASLHDLRDLVNRSLLERTATGRYEMHALLRQYAAEKLAASPNCGKEIDDRHAAYYTAAAQQWAAKGDGPQQVKAFAEFEADVDNVYAAWDWIVQHTQIERIAAIINGMNWFFEWSGRYQEAEQAYQSLVAELEAIETPSPEVLRILAKGLASQAMFGRMSGMEPRQVAREQLQRALDLVQGPRLVGQDTRAERAFILRQMGDVIPNYADIQLIYRQSLSLYRELGDRSGMTAMLASLGRITATLGDYDEAKHMLGEALTICRARGEPLGVAGLLGALSEVAVAQGEFEDARRLARESMTLCRDSNDRGAVRNGRLWCASVLSACGEFAKALSLLQRSAREHEESGQQFRATQTSLRLGFVQIHLGMYEQARAELRIVLAHLREMDARLGLAIALQGLAKLDIAEGAYARAAKRLQEGSAASAQVGRPRIDSTYACLMGCNELGLGHAVQAKQHFTKAIGVTIQVRAIFPALYSTALVARWMCSQDMLQQGIELYALSLRYASVANSRWFEDVAGKHVAAAAETLTPDIVAAAQERGKARDLWATLEKLLDELSGPVAG